jgi:hypothetical protein
LKDRGNDKVKAGGNRGEKPQGQGYCRGCVRADWHDIAFFEYVLYIES